MSTQTHTAETSEPLGEPVRVRRALISVSDKTGVVDFAAGPRGAGGGDRLHGRHRGGAAGGGRRGATTSRS